MHTIIFIIFWDFLIFYQIFLSPQVKRCEIITYKYGINLMSHQLPNNIRLGGFSTHTRKKKRDLRNYEISEKWPHPRQNQNSPNTKKEPPKNRNQTPPAMRHPTKNQSQPQRPHEWLHPPKPAARRNAPPPALRDQDEGICRQFSHCFSNLVIILPSKIFTATLTSTIP